MDIILTKSLAKQKNTRRENIHPYNNNDNQNIMENIMLVFTMLPVVSMNYSARCIYKIPYLSI